MGQIQDMFDVNAIGAGVGAAVAVGLGVPWLARTFPQLPQSGPGLRVVQAAAGVGIAVLLRQSGFVSRQTAQAVGSFAIVFASMGLIRDLGLLERFGLPAPVPIGGVTPASIAQLAGMGEYRYGDQFMLGPGSVLDPGADMLSGMEDAQTFGM